MPSSQLPINENIPPSDGGSFEQPGQDGICELAQHRDAAARKLRTAFAKDEKDPFIEAGCEWLYDEWSLSRDAGVSADATPTQRDFKVFDRITDAQRMHLSTLSYYYSLRHDTVKELGAALFYLDDKLAVYHKEGSKALLGELKERGLRIGSVLDIKSFGCNAASIAMERPLCNIVRVGSENYLSEFSDYVLMARFDTGGPYGFAGSNLIVAPLEAFDATMESFLGYLLKLEDISYGEDFIYPPVRARNSLIEMASALDRDIALVVDDESTVVYANPKFVDIFGKSVSAHSSFEPLETFFPELSFTTRVLSGGKPVVSQSIECRIDGKRHHFFVDCLPLKKDDAILGMKIVLRTLSQLSAYTRPLRGSTAIHTFDSIKGESAQLVESKGVAAHASGSSSNVLITGESGTGKELFAQAIHNASERSSKPFVALNCGALPKELVGSELFGYEEGAFTGAKKGGHIGMIEQADEGTLFLDEIGEMPLDVQVVLLRFLDSGEITRLGGKRSIPVNARIIAATNRNLPECIQNGSFRLDLYYRLNILTIMLPPLRERSSDIDILVNHFLGTLSAKLGKTLKEASPEVLALFRSQPWPGNVRELRNVVERCVNLVPDGIEKLELDFIPEGLFAAANARLAFLETPAQADNSRVSPSAIDYRQEEESEIRQLLVKMRGNKSKVAEALGITRTTLYSKMRKYGIPL